MDINLKKRILSLSDEELLNLYERDYEDYRGEALEYAKEEIENRGIEKKIWFYNDWYKKYGPYSRDEIIDLVRNKEIKKDFHLWREGLSDWIELKYVNLFGDQELNNNHVSSDNDSFNRNEIIKPPSFNPSLFKSKTSTATYDYEAGKSGVKVAGILFIIIGTLWGISSLLAFLIGLVDIFGYMDYLIAGWNLTVSIGIIFIGIGITRGKEWSYRWGVGTSEINIVFHLLRYKEHGKASLFFVPIFIVALILLIKNKKIFEDKEIEREKTTDN